jgi:hypothetical protein
VPAKVLIQRRNYGTTHLKLSPRIIRFQRSFNLVPGSINIFELIITFIFGVLVVGLWLFLKVCRKHNSDLPTKSFRTLDGAFIASRALIRVVAFMVGCLLWWLPLTFMPADIEGLFCMGSFGTLLIIYGLAGPQYDYEIHEEDRQVIETGDVIGSSPMWID